MYTGLLRAIPRMRHVLASYAVRVLDSIFVLQRAGNTLCCPCATVSNMGWETVLCIQGHLRCTPRLHELPAAAAAHSVGLYLS